MSRRMVVGVAFLLVVGCKPAPVADQPATTTSFLLWMRASGTKEVKWFDVSPQLASNLGRPAAGVDYGLVMTSGKQVTPLFMCGSTCSPCRPPSEHGGGVALGIDCPPEPPVPCPPRSMAICPRHPQLTFLQQAAHNPEWLPQLPDGAEGPGGPGPGPGPRPGGPERP